MITCRALASFHVDKYPHKSLAKPNLISFHPVLNVHFDHGILRDTQLYMICFVGKMSHDHSSELVLLLLFLFVLNHKNRINCHAEYEKTDCKFPEVSKLVKVVNTWSSKGLLFCPAFVEGRTGLFS